MKDVIIDFVERISTIFQMFQYANKRHAPSAFILLSELWFYEEMKDNVLHINKKTE